MQESHEFWIGPYLALSYARPDQFLSLLSPVMDCLQDVLQADDDDLDIYDCAHLLMYYMVLLPTDASRQRRLKVCIHLTECCCSCASGLPVHTR